LFSEIPRYNLYYSPTVITYFWVISLKFTLFLFKIKNKVIIARRLVIWQKKKKTKQAGEDFKCIEESSCNLDRTRSLIIPHCTQDWRDNADSRSN
jgi:hypothetical protein